MTLLNLLQTVREGLISAYDGAYIAVAESKHIPFLTADKKLFNNLKHHFGFVKWIEDYQRLKD